MRRGAANGLQRFERLSDPACFDVLPRFEFLLRNRDLMLVATEPK
jgi:hypothetical protein